MKKKQHTTQEIRATHLALISGITCIGKQSLRKLAALINRSKSSVHRHEQSLEKRNQHPESMLWKTEAGQAWLNRGRTASYPTAPSQIPACGITAQGSSKLLTCTRYRLSHQKA